MCAKARSLLLLSILDFCFIIKSALDGAKGNIIIFELVRSGAKILIKVKGERFFGAKENIKLINAQRRDDLE